MARPLVFIGSSAEGRDYAAAIQIELRQTAECVNWWQGPFGVGDGTLDALVRALETFDFAILVLTPDDLLASRGDTKPAPRDNVLLELGMFIGGLGRDRTYMVVDQDAKLKLPTDLAGVTYATFQPPKGGTKQSAVGPACFAIQEAIKRLGARKPQFSIVGGCKVYSRGMRSGIRFTVKNIGTKPIPPYSLSIHHPNLPQYSLFESKKQGPLLADQKREHFFCVLENGKVMPFLELTVDRHGNRVDDALFEFQVVLEDSDLILYTNRRIARGFVKLVRLAVANGAMLIGDTEDDWQELDNSLPDE